VPETQRRERVVTRPGHERKRDKGAIALFNIGPARHSQSDMPDLLNVRNGPSPCGFRDSRVFQRKRKIFRVNVSELRFEPTLLR
jgi:hypothetical protein